MCVGVPALVIDEVSQTLIDVNVCVILAMIPISCANHHLRAANLGHC